MDESGVLNIKLNQIKKVLKDNFRTFLERMKAYFSTKLENLPETAKEDLDMDIRNLFTDETVHLYNEFWIAFNARIYQNESSTESECTSAETLSTTKTDAAKKGLKRQNQKKAHALGGPRKIPKYSPIDVKDYIPTSEPIDLNNVKPFYCISHGTLPDAVVIRGRMLIEAWLENIEHVEDSVMTLLVASAKTYMHNVLSTVLQRKYAFKTRENRFRYAVGSPPGNIFIKNSPKRPSLFNRRTFAPRTRASLDYFESDVALEAACDNAPRPRQRPLSASDFLDALKVHRSAFRSNTVYALNVERSISSMHHTTVEEEEQDRLKEQEKKLKAEITGEITFPSL